MHVLVINCGSSSVRFKVFDSDRAQVLHEGRIERIGEAGGAASHGEAVASILADLKGVEIRAVGHRVVHGGPRFHEATLIDDDVVAEIDASAPLAPLHNPAHVAGIEATRKALPDVPEVAVFDTAFFNRLPRRSRTYAIDPDLANQIGARRYGFHGTSHEYVAGEAAEHLGVDITELRIISCHLGNGASVAAIEFGHPLDTSMGMTPLEGLVMGTRAGDVDPAIVTHLIRCAGLDADAVERVLNQESGLLGLSGHTNDMRDLEARAADGDDRARMAISVFSHRVRKYIGAYSAVLGGVDAIVLTGGIGENSVSMRQRLFQRMRYLGIVMDESVNEDASVGVDQTVAEVSAANSRVKVLVVKTDEEWMIARKTADVIAGQRDVSAPGPIPIAVSARHCHLDAETFALLFGEGASPTKYKEISQPGQYASNEKVNLVGPRGRIDGVRLVGPLRSYTQVEVSRTDEFLLGVDAPIRRSGAVKDSAPITLEGPKGTLALTEGLICARRHVHMTPADAEAYGVEAGDEIEIAITGGPRDLVFGDVLVRVNPNYKLEMHIDTDEANAAELSSKSEGGLVYTDILDGAEATVRSKRVRRAR